MKMCSADFALLRHSKMICYVASAGSNTLKTRVFTCFHFVFSSMQLEQGMMGLIRSIRLRRILRKSFEELDLNLTNLDQDSFTGRSYKQSFVVRGILFEVLRVKISYAMQKLDYTVYVSRVTSCKIDLWISYDTPVSKLYL